MPSLCSLLKVYKTVTVVCSSPKSVHSLLKQCQGAKPIDFAPHSRTVSIWCPSDVKYWTKFVMDLLEVPSNSQLKHLSVWVLWKLRKKSVYENVLLLFWVNLRDIRMGTFYSKAKERKSERVFNAFFHYPSIVIVWHLHCQWTVYEYMHLFGLCEYIVCWFVVYSQGHMRQRFRGGWKKRFSVGRFRLIHKNWSLNLCIFF